MNNTTQSKQVQAQTIFRMRKGGGMVDVAIIMPDYYWEGTFRTRGEAIFFLRRNGFPVPKKRAAA